MECIHLWDTAKEVRCIFFFFFCGNQSQASDPTHIQQGWVTTGVEPELLNTPGPAWPCGGGFGNPFVSLSLREAKLSSKSPGGYGSVEGRREMLTRGQSPSLSYR